jgi:hypothetical protein
MNGTTSKAHTVAGVSFPENLSIDADGAIAHDVSVPVAWAGELTTRGGDTTGTITLDESAHLVDTGERIDLYWNGGSRRGCTAGTVSGNSVPVSGGSGDNLPSQEEDITIGIPVELDIGVDGDNVVLLALYIGALGQFVFTDDASAPVEKMAQTVGPIQTWDWNNTNGVTNPLTGDTIAKVFVSHDDTESAQTARVGILYDNA